MTKSKFEGATSDCLENACLRRQPNLVASLQQPLQGCDEICAGAQLFCDELCAGAPKNERVCLQSEMTLFDLSNRVIFFHVFCYDRHILSNYKGEIFFT